MLYYKDLHALGLQYSGEVAAAQGFAYRSVYNSALIHVELTKGREDTAGMKRFIDPIKFNIKGLKTFQLETKQIHQFHYNVTHVLQIQVL